MLATTYKLIHGDAVLMAQPLLIQQYGRVGALLIQQIHYWSQKGCGVVQNNQRWIHNTVEQWADQLCVSASTVKRAVQKLLHDGAINVKKMAKHKSNQTNSYAINHERLEELMKLQSHKNVSQNNDSLTTLENQNENLNNQDESSITYKTPSENISKTHQVKMTSSPDQCEPLVIQKTTYKDNNKSTHARSTDDSIHTNKVGEYKTNEVSQVENINLSLEEEVLCFKQDSSDKPTSGLPPTLVKDMVNIWNNEVSINKKELSFKINCAISKYLVACFKYKFNNDLELWKHYCRLMASSSYLMSKDFVLSLSWAVKFSTIDRILAGELGVKKIERVRTEEELHAEALRHIDGVGESESCKATRRAILVALGSTNYNAWFTKVDVLDDGATLKPHNTFVEAAIQARFGHVLERVGR